MAHTLRARFVAALTAATLGAIGVGALVPSTASAATTSLFNQPFHNATADGDGAVVLPKPVNDPNAACLTATGNTTVVPKSCTTTPTDAVGSGKLRLTDDSTYKVGGLFAATSVPTVSGLDLTFNTYQYGDRNDSAGADGIAFVLAAVDPTSPTAPANIGPNGGSLGYSATNTGTAAGAKGLSYGYLGIGFDVYGNFSNNRFQGIDCGSPAYIASNTQVKSQVIVRGPGNGSAGYCPVTSTATGNTGQTAVPLRARTRDASKMPVEVVINPSSKTVASPSGISVPAKSFAVQFTPVGTTAARTLTGTLPTVAGSLNFPSTWLDPAGYPKQLAFGWVGSTGGFQDAHELDTVKVLSLSAVPELTVAQTAYTASAPAAGDPVSYVVRAGVDTGVDETSPISVTDTLPTGVTPTGGFGDGWTCASPAGQKITCTNSAVPVKAGSSLPNLTITGTVTGSGVTATTIQNNSIVTASSNDANPAYSSTAAAGTPSSAPSNLTISPASGPSGSAATITGTNTANATAVQVGTSAELAAGTGTTLSPCTNNTPAAGCFTVNATSGAIGISSMPTHANGAVQVKVVTLGAAANVGFTYTSVPGTPTVTASAGAQSATATWNAPATGGSAITGYTLTPYKDGVAQTAVALGATVTTYTVTGANAGSSYTFTVAARNSNGTGVVSPQSNAVVPYTTPGAPTAVSATEGTGQARVSWTAPASNGYSAVTGYVVTPYLNGTAQTPVVFDSTATTQTVTGLTAGRSYTFTVAARNAAGTGPASGTSNAVVVNAAPSITSVPGRGEVGAAYSQQLAVTGGTAGYTFSVSDGALPDGLTLSSSGLISGTPVTDGSSLVTVRVTDASGASSTRTFTVVVVPPPSLTFTPALPDTTVGASYSQALSSTGGTGPYTFSLSAGSLPAGLSLDAASGILSGTATKSGTYSFTVKVVDALGQGDTRAATLAVRTVPGTPTLGAVTAGTSSAVVRWTAPTDDGNSPVTGYVVTPYLNGTAQPAQTAGASATRLVVTGLDAGSSYTFTVAAVNAIGTGPATARSTAVVPNPGPAITNVPDNGEVGAAYSLQLVSDGGTGASSYTLTSGSLPAGLTLSLSGLLSGSPTTAGSSTFRVQVTDEDGQSSNRSFTVVVAAQPTLTYTSSLPTATVGGSYEQALTRTGGTGPFTFSVSSGSLPAGLALDPATGTVSGTPTASGSSTFTVKVVDSFGQSDMRLTTLAVRDVPAAPGAPTVVVGTGTARVSWSAPSSDGGSAVTGYVVTPYVGSVAQTPVAFSSTATTQTITGLDPSTPYTFTVAALNAVGTGPASARSAEVTVNAAPRITTAPGQGEVGAAYSQQLAVAGGTGPFTFDLTDGTLPAGLSLDGAGLLAGTPTTAGRQTVTVKVTDASGVSSSRELTITVVAAPTLTYDPALPAGTVGAAYSQPLTRTGGTGPFTYSVSGGTLPAGLVLDAASGLLSGTPTGSGDSTFTVTLVDSLGQRDTKLTTVAVRTVPAAPAVTSVEASTTSARVRWAAPTEDGNSAVTGYVVTPYLGDQALASYTFDDTATSHVITGLAPGGPYTFTVAAVNAIGTGAPSVASTGVTVNPRPSVTGALGAGEVGVVYDQQLGGTGGTGALTFSLGSGSLPAGLVLSSTGRVTGTPTQAGSSTVSVRVTDAAQYSASRSFVVVVGPAPSLTFDAGLPDAERGTAYSADLSATGGKGPFTYSVSDGTLPTGLTLDAGTGVVSGTPTRGGSYTFTVKVVDSLGAVDTRAATLLVKAPADVALTASSASTTIGSTVTLNAALDPSSSTGTVTFTATAPDGSSVELGSDTLSGGRASLRTSFSTFGRWSVVAVYAGDASHLAASSAVTTVEVAATAGQVVITELRTSGPAGPEDSYAEIYNPGPPVPLAGFTLLSGSGAKTVLPVDAPVLGTHRTYLVAGRDFSLTRFATPDRTGSLGTGGLQLVAPDTAATVTDAVGPASGLHLGKALPTLTGSPTAQWAFVRVEKAGRPVNSGQNGSDFALVSSDGGKVGGVQSMRGSASPTGLGDDWQHDEQAQSYLLDQSVSADAVPNRPYVVGKPGILEIRRTITNTGTSTITSAKARVTSLSEANGLPYYGASAPATPAAIRAVNPKTATSSAAVKGRGTVTVQNLRVDAPITAASGGGLNSTFTIPLPDGGLAPGASVDVAFTFEVDVRGTFWFGYDVDARTADQSLRTASKTSATVSTKTVQRRLAATGKQESKAVAPMVRGSL